MSTASPPTSIIPPETNTTSTMATEPSTTISTQPTETTTTTTSATSGIVQNASTTTSTNATTTTTVIDSSAGISNQSAEANITTTTTDNMSTTKNTTINITIPSDTILQAETIKVASWNIENFGKTKATDSARMRVISGILKNYDLIALQEISNVNEMNDAGCPRNEDACPGHTNCNMIKNSLEKYLNEENGLNYRFVFSPQVKDERYLYIYNPDVVALESYNLTIDPEDSMPICDSSPPNTGKMVRQPFKAKFMAGNFDFVLLTAHTSPSVNIQELEGLEYFYRQTETEGEPDVIILGDLNADCDYLRAADNISLRKTEYIWVIGDDSDTVVSARSCAYDRFIFKKSTSEDYTGTWGIYTEVPDNVSDHYPIWAEFSTIADSS